jgi:ATP-binding cassette subfamily F protein uup
VLVTHDRFMLDRVSTVILALDGEGGAETYADYAQWEAARAARSPAPRAQAGGPPALAPRPRTKRLGYLEQREWEGMERAVLDAETAAEACRQAAEDPGIAADPAALQARYEALEAARAEVARLYVRWTELEAKQA